MKHELINDSVRTTSALYGISKLMSTYMLLRLDIPSVPYTHPFYGKGKVVAIEEPPRVTETNNVVVKALLKTKNGHHTFTISAEDVTESFAVELFDAVYAECKHHALLQAYDDYINICVENFNA